MVAALIPLGFATVSQLSSVVAENARSTEPWNLRATVGAKALISRVERVVGEHGEVAEYLYPGSDAQFISELGQRLPSGEIEAHAIVQDTGELVRMTAADWRRPFMKDNEMIAPICVARDGSLLPLVRPNSPTVMVLPIVALRDLAIAFGATSPPPPPDPNLFEGSGVQFASETFPEPGQGVKARHWMHGFAQGYLDGKGDKVNGITLSKLVALPPDVLIEKLATPGVRYQRLSSGLPEPPPKLSRIVPISFVR